MEDSRDSRIWIDDNGEEWLTDEDGNVLKDQDGNMIPPTQSKVVDESASFRTYDTSRGHCGLCGSLYCNGGCFK